MVNVKYLVVYLFIKFSNHTVSEPIAMSQQNCWFNSMVPLKNLILINRRN